MTTTAIASSHTAPRTSALAPATAGRLAANEYERFADLLGGLRDEQWNAPTVCTGWTVRSVAVHCLGMAQMAATNRETVRQNLLAMRRSRRTGEVFIDALTGLQVDERADLSPAQIVAGYVAVGPKAARARFGSGRLLRGMRIPGEQFPGDLPWTLGYLKETIMTRDPWMHRIDITDAVGYDMVLTADHDGVLVDDIVKEWAARHGRPCSIALTGPAGGRWTFGTGGPDLAYDTLDFCRRISGRAPAEGLTTTQVPF
jgi:uncharacterized protein (TIGR03083 family)